MKLPIKFRGLSKYSGKNVYGDFYHGKKIVYVDLEPVDPESVKQLVGYDKDGREVYEGDALETDEGTIYASVLRHAKIAPCNDMEFSEMAERFGWKLKEVAENENDG